MILIIPAALIPWLIGAGGALLSRTQSLGDIGRQNAYNHPLNQVRRLREAGLPMAALSGGMAGNQSALPESSKDLPHSISQYATTQAQLKQLELIKEEIRLKRAEADKFGAERDWYLSGGPGGSTNLVNTLRTRLGMEQAQLGGQNIQNQISQYNLNNTPYRIQLENIKSNAEISNLLKQNNLIDENITGTELDNRIKTITAAYSPQMTQQQFEKLLKENGLIQANISGKHLDNALGIIRNRIEENTESSTIMSRGAEAALKSITWERVKEEFENYKQYQKFVDLVQEELNRNPIDRLKNPTRTLRGIVAWAYTTVTGVTGQGSSQLLNLVK